MAEFFALLFTIFIVFVESKVYDRCELARELKNVHKFPDTQIATWVCIVKHESTFNTSAVNQGSGDHGLFQISNLFWCSPPGSGFACNAACSSFEDDDITDDVECIRRIFKEHSVISGNGYSAWAVYPLYCNNDVSKYVEGCFDNEIDNTINLGPSQPSTSATIEPDDDDDGYNFPPLPTHHKKTEVQKKTVYEFPPVATTLGSDNKKGTFPYATTSKSFPSRTQNRISNLPTTSKIYSISTLKPPIKSFRDIKQFKETKAFSDYKPFKSYSSFKQDVRPTSAKPVKKATSTTPRTFSFSSRVTNNFRKSSTLTPLSFVYENVHSDRKREQKLNGGGNSEYSFLWTANGFRLVRN